MSSRYSPVASPARTPRQVRRAANQSFDLTGAAATDSTIAAAQEECGGNLTPSGDSTPTKRSKTEDTSMDESGFEGVKTPLEQSSSQNLYTHVRALGPRDLRGPLGPRVRVEMLRRSLLAKVAG